MSNDDIIEGDGNIPTVEQISGVRDQLLEAGRIKMGSRKGDHRGIRPTHQELLARGFKCSLSRVQRTLAIIDKEREPPEPAIDNSLSKNRGNNKKGSAPPVLTKEDVVLDDPSLVSAMAKLLEEANTSTVLAIKENRVRMALNVVIAERMAASPGLLLLDMRGAAALVDALTMASKLSGGASIDIHVPALHEMRKAADARRAEDAKVIEPATKTELQSNIEAYRLKRNNGASAA
jgi:hypothetical protein